jgi:hypothetical protein
MTMNVIVPHGIMHPSQTLSLALIAAVINALSAKQASARRPLSELA